MRYYIGLDGGGTKTVCLLGSERGEVLARGVAGPSNHNTVGLEQAQAALKTCICDAIDKHGPRFHDIESIAIGMSGIDRPADRALITEIIDKLGLRFRLRLVDNDASIALAGATHGQPGVVIICGTGSIAFGMNSKGERRRSSGWGPVLGDEGSGYDIGRQAMIAALRDADGRGHATILRRMLIEHLQLSSIENLVGKVYGERMPANEIAALAPLVFTAASKDDDVATKILANAGKELAEAAVAVIHKLGLGETEFDVALVGSVFKSTGILKDVLIEMIYRSAPLAKVIAPRFEPVVGALIMAYKNSGLEITDDLLETIAKSLQ